MPLRCVPLYRHSAGFQNDFRYIRKDCIWTEVGFSPYIGLRALKLCERPFLTAVNGKTREAKEAEETKLKAQKNQLGGWLVCES